MGFLRQRPDGTTSLNIITGESGVIPGTEKDRPVLLGSLLGKVKQGTGSIQVSHIYNSGYSKNRYIFDLLQQIKTIRHDCWATVSILFSRDFGKIDVMYQRQFILYIMAHTVLMDPHMTQPLQTWQRKKQNLYTSKYAINYAGLRN